MASDSSRRSQKVPRDCLERFQVDDDTVAPYRQHIKSSYHSRIRANRMERMLSVVERASAVALHVVG